MDRDSRKGRIEKGVDPDTGMCPSSVPSQSVPNGEAFQFSCAPLSMLEFC